MSAIREIWRCLQSHLLRKDLIMVFSSTSTGTPSPNIPVSLPTNQSRVPNSRWSHRVKYISALKEFVVWWWTQNQQN